MMNKLILKCVCLPSVPTFSGLSLWSVVQMNYWCCVNLWCCVPFQLQRARPRPSPGPAPVWVACAGRFASRQNCSSDLWAAGKDSCESPWRRAVTTVTFYGSNLLLCSSRCCVSHFLWHFFRCRDRKTLPVLRGRRDQQKTMLTETACVYLTLWTLTWSGIKCSNHHFWFLCLLTFLFMSENN